jgi:hypothetical protein
MRTDSYIENKQSACEQLMPNQNVNKNETKRQLFVYDK